MILLCDEAVIRSNELVITDSARLADPLADPIKSNHINLEPDLKTLNVQALRQLAEDNNLLQKGEKKTKKELLVLIESMNK